MTLPPPSSSDHQSTPKFKILEEDCDRPSCDDIKSTLPKSLEEYKAMAEKYSKSKKVQCPPFKSELGRSSWTLLHTMVRSFRFFNLLQSRFLVDYVSLLFEVILFSFFVECWDTTFELFLFYSVFLSHYIRANWIGLGRICFMCFY